MSYGEEPSGHVYIVDTAVATTSAPKFGPHGAKGWSQVQGREGKCMDEGSRNFVGVWEVVGDVVGAAYLRVDTA